MFNLLLFYKAMEVLVDLVVVVAVRNKKTNNKSKFSLIFHFNMVYLGYHG